MSKILKDSEVSKASEANKSSQASYASIASPLILYYLKSASVAAKIAPEAPRGIFGEILGGPLRLWGAPGGIINPLSRRSARKSADFQHVPPRGSCSQLRRPLTLKCLGNNTRVSGCVNLDPGKGPMADHSLRPPPPRVFPKVVACHGIGNTVWPTPAIKPVSEVDA